MCFRSKSGVKYFCDGLSVIQTIKNRGENLFSAVTNRFNRSELSLLPPPVVPKQLQELAAVF